MTGSEYEVDVDTGRAIRLTLKNFLKENPPGSEVTTYAMGEHHTVTVTGMSNCPEDERYPCEVELEYKPYGGYANYYVRLKEKEAQIRISGADFPHPLEFIIAEKTIGLPITDDRDWCFRKYGESSLYPVYCSKRRW